MACLLPELLICYALDVLFVLRLGMGLFHACSPAVLVQAQGTRGAPRHAHQCTGMEKWVPAIVPAFLVDDGVV